MTSSFVLIRHQAVSSGGVLLYPINSSSFDDLMLGAASSAPIREAYMCPHRYRASSLRDDCRGRASELANFELCHGARARLICWG